MAMSFSPADIDVVPVLPTNVKVDDEEVIEYYHRGVVFHLVGFPIAMPLEVEMIRPREER